MVTVRIRDTSFSIDRGHHPHSWEKEANPHWENYKDMLKFLSSIGFYVGEDKEIKKRYPTLNENSKEGGFGELRFKVQYAANIFEITFYQDIRHENPYGGYYDFDKYEKMPYLIQKRYDWTVNKLLTYFQDRGYQIEFARNTCKGEAFIINDYIRSCHHPQKQWFSLSEIEGLPDANGQGGNGMDRDRKQIKNGDVKYSRDWSGYLIRGRVFHDLNKMWWMLLPDGTVRNIACFELFDLQETDCRGRQKMEMIPYSYAERKRQLSLFSTKDLERELKRRKGSTRRKN